MKQNILIVLSLVVALIFGCQDDKHEPLVSGNTKPNSISNVQVENTPGGARITYTLPKDKDLLYIEAFFSSKEGEQRTAKSSYYNNFVELEGFVNQDEAEVTLYTVNRAEIRSEPVVVKIKPLISPIELALDSLEIREDYGGVNLRFFNAAKKEYIVNTVIKNELGNWVTYDRLYSQAPYRDYSVRGLLSKETEFAFYLVDKWKNKSDTIFKTLVPLYEELLDKKSWKHYPLDDVFKPRYSDRPISKVWDGGLNNTQYFIGDEPAEAPLPHHFTIYLGKEMKLSRLKVHQYQGPTFYAYTIGNPKKYEIWGSNELTPDASYDGWTLLLECESIKPSGLPTVVKTKEDDEYASAGEDYTFPLDSPPVKYIRFRTLETWGKRANLLLGEITLWGQDPNNVNSQN